MALPRVQPLIVAPDEIPEGVIWTSLTERQKVIHDMMTASHSNYHIIRVTHKALGSNVHTCRQAQALPVYLTYKKLGGKDVTVAKTWSPWVLTGTHNADQVRQISLNTSTSTMMKWTSERLSLSMWLDDASTRKLGLTKIEHRMDAWKRWLIRFWAGCFPNAQLFTGTIDHEAKQIEAENGICDFAEWWEKFNINPKSFNLDNPKIYLSVARSFMTDTIDYFTDDQLPPLQVLKDAVESSLRSNGRKTVDQTASFSFWRAGTSLEEGAEYKVIYGPSLNTVKEQGLERIEAEKNEESRIVQGERSFYLGQEIERRWKLTPAQFEQEMASLDEAVERNKARHAAANNLPMADNLWQAITDQWALVD